VAFNTSEYSESAEPWLRSSTELGVISFPGYLVGSRLYGELLHRLTIEYNTAGAESNTFSNGRNAVTRSEHYAQVVRIKIVSAVL